MLLRRGDSLVPNPDIVSFGVDTRPLPLQRTGGFRIVVVGGSSARGLLLTTGTELVEYSFSTRLEAELPSLVAGRVEVFNLAVPGFGSRRVRSMVRDALQLKPDLVIAYYGHNEFIEDRIRRFYAEEESWRAFARKLILRTWTGRLYLRKYREPSRAAATLRFGGQPEVAVSNDMDPALVSEQFEKEAAEVLSRTRTQTAEIIALCREAAVPILIVPAVPNLLDRPVRPGIGAVAWWEEGRRLQAAGDTQACLTSYRLALDQDGWGLRASPRVRSVLLEVARNEGAEVLDLWDTMQATALGVPLFADYCHPNEEGHRRLEAWMREKVATILLAARNAAGGDSGRPVAPPD